MPELAVATSEVKQATGLTNEELRDCFSILDKNNFTYDNGHNDFGVEEVGIQNLKSGWPVWVDIKRFCKKRNIDIANLIINLDFSLLD